MEGPKMSPSTLPVFSRPQFPQVVQQLFASEVRQVNKVLGLCCFESFREGIRDFAYSCQETATVFCLADEQEYCLSHFREVERG
jgi:hypothetical protein